MRRTGVLLCLLLATGIVGGSAAQAAKTPTTTTTTPKTKTTAPPAPVKNPVVTVTQTSIDLSQALKRVAKLRFSNSPSPRGLGVISVADSAANRYQRIVGVGGAMTDTSAWLLYDELTPSGFKRAMQALFGPNGIHLSFIRVPMGGSDFTAEGYPYTYDDIPIPGSDPGLTQFSIGHDRPYIIPSLKQALKLNPFAQLIATPWTPPRFMKTNDNFDNTNNDSYLLPTMLQPLANYFVKFLKAYAAAGIPVTAITPQNEPGNATWYPGLNLPAPTEAQFITDYLKPSLKRAKLKTQIFGFDYHWAYAADYVGTLLNMGAGYDLTGIAYHCYAGSPTVMSDFHNLVPRLQQWVTECTSQTNPVWIPAEVEIASIRNWASAVALWNLALDPQGGPVQAPNSACQGCTGLVTVNEATHTISYGQPYYMLGQVSKFLQPGAVRIASNHFVSYSPNGASPGLDDVAFLNPDGNEALVTYNNSGAPVTFGVSWHGESLSYTLPAWGMATFNWHAMSPRLAPKAPSLPKPTTTPKKKTKPKK